jgi:hypothetical protein
MIPILDARGALGVVVAPAKPAEGPLWSLA